MGGLNRSFPFLALPIELRTKIYEDLLSPNPHESHILYHDRIGRSLSFNIFPSILRASTQIYSEAVGILYGRNTFKIQLTTPPGHLICEDYYEDGPLEPISLFRQDLTPCDEMPGQWTGDFDSIAAVNGVIYPHCFRRIRKLELVTSHDALWSQKATSEYRLTDAGELLHEILRILIADQNSSPSMIKALKLTDEQHQCQQLLCQRYKASTILAPRRIGFLELSVTETGMKKDRNFVETLKLLTSVQRCRQLSLWEISDSCRDPWSADYSREINLAGLDQIYSVGQGAFY